MNYLDINKSVVISSPAGSGKTEKLARRYIALLQSGADVERILAITFTDKAAAEMKQRILKILEKEDKTLFNQLLEKMSLMRVSTIHSFCGTLLRRFSFEASIDPNYRIEDAIDSRISWEGIIYEILMEAGEGRAGHELLLQTLGERGFRGLEYLKTTINDIFEKRPFSLEARIPEFSLPATFFTLVDELKNWCGAKEAIEGYESLFDKDAFYRLASVEKHFLTDNKSPRIRVPGYLKGIADYRDWAVKMFFYWNIINIEQYTRRAIRIKEIFLNCFSKYSEKKLIKGCLDFSDLEYITYKLLTENPEWANILYAFDEKTDHILVDEFQDTNHFQWAIIDRLTEEWRSGAGAKRVEGTRPTIFLVGDEKQSIYFFRGANVEIFRRAEEKLREWLKEEFCYEEAKENFRSLPAIINFANHVFSRIMTPVENSPLWVTKYNPFEASRKDTQDSGRVELILLGDDTETTMETKRKEAEIIAKRIRSIVGGLQITDRSGSTRTEASFRKRPCSYMDIALLLRKRTHLRQYEDAFRKYSIPFVAVKGIGFYQEPEVAVLRALIYFLANPKDDYSLYILLKSPFFMLDEETIVKAVHSKGDCLFSRLRDLSNDSVKLLEEWLSQSAYMPISELIEKILIQTKAWEYFYETQRKANVKKFIRLVEDLENAGKSLPKIRDFLERTYSKEDEPKANVNTEGMDAVRIMTIHGAKGLEFPIVFLPGLEESFISGTNDTLIYDADGTLFLKYISESSIRKLDEEFSLYKRKEEEEQKRLFYVGITRAEEALFLTGQWLENKSGFLGLLKEGLNLERAGKGFRGDKIPGLFFLSEDDVNILYKKRPAIKVKKAVQERAEFIPVETGRAQQWKAVTGAVDIRRQHGKEWVILGDVFHRIFEGISKGTLKEEDVRLKAERLLVLKGVLKDERERLLSVVEKNINLLKQKRIWQDVIMQRKDSFAELPFVLETGDAVYTGRVDRVLENKGAYEIYDYKTFPVNEKEMDYLLKEYSFQLGVYREAVKQLFKTKKVRSFIVFTHTGEMKEVN